jgi:hypothetical protein
MSTEINKSKKYSKEERKIFIQKVTPEVKTILNSKINTIITAIKTKHLG